MVTWLLAELGSWWHDWLLPAELLAELGSWAHGQKIEEDEQFTICIVQRKKKDDEGIFVHS